jgi:predicted deacylase
MIPQIETINLVKLASGDTISIQIYRFIGNQPGKKAYIQSNLHGSEIVGNAVIYQLIEEFSHLDCYQINGEICLVPACNPFGTNQRTHYFSTGRFNSYDGKDWNRIFWDYEKVCKNLKVFAQSQLDLATIEIRRNFLDKQKLAFEKHREAIDKPSSVPFREKYRYHLQSLCLDANYVIDIHSSSNQGIDYTYCFKTREESTKYLLLDYAILMNEYDGDAFDEAFMKPWLALERQLAKLGRKLQFDVESYTLELGSGMEMNPESVEKGVQGIKNYLVYQEILNLPEYPLTTSQMTLVTRQQMKSYYAPTGGMIQNRLPLKSKVKAGDRLYQILTFNKVGELPSIIDVCAETDGLIFDISTNYAVNQGEYVLGIMNYEL